MRDTSRPFPNRTSGCRHCPPIVQVSHLWKTGGYFGRPRDVGLRPEAYGHLVISVRFSRFPTHWLDAAFLKATNEQEGQEYADSCKMICLDLSLSLQQEFVIFGKILDLSNLISKWVLFGEKVMIFAKKPTN